MPISTETRQVRSGRALCFMKEIIKTYIEWKATYAQRAAVNYRIWLERLVEVCGDKPVQDFELRDFLKYKYYIERRYNPYTIQLATVVIKNFLQFCKMQNINCLNPTLIKLPRVFAKSHRAITENEFLEMVKRVPDKRFGDLRDLLMIHLLWDTGMRVSELTDMEVSQIDLANSSALINTKKTGYKRTIVWSEKTHELMRRYISVRKSECPHCTSTALFLGWKNGLGWYSRITPRTIERIVKRYAQDAGILEKVTPHSFRHGWAHMRRDMNAPLAFIQKGLGHLNPVSTFVYEQYKDADFERNAKAYLK